MESYGFAIFDQDMKPYLNKVFSSEDAAIGYIEGIKDISGLDFSYTQLFYHIEQP